MHSLSSDLAAMDVVDFHSHILPGADHGSENLETSLAQLKIAKKYSVNRIVATPHFYPSVHTLSGFLAMRNRAVDTLKQALTTELPQFKVGAEVLICEGLERFPSLEKLCFQNTKHIMLELPFFGFSEEYAETAGQIVDMGYNVILAHADRYPKEDIEVMLDYGVKNLQINASSLASVFKKKHIFNWIENGFVCMIGSDIHGPGAKAYRHFSKAKKNLKEFLSIIKKSSDKIWNEIEIP